MLEVASVSIVLGYFLLIWLRTDAFVEYMNLLGLSKFFRIHEYNELHSNGYGGNYVEFLYEYFKDRFFVRLVSCPVCLSFWLGIIVFLFGDALSYILSAPLILFFYLVFNRML